MSYRGRGRGGFHSNHNNRNGVNNQNIDQFVAANSIPVEILGWNGASMEDCVNFISRKCRIVVSNPSIDPNTGVLKGYVKTQAEANQLVTWSGVKFAGQLLRISKSTDSNAPSNTFSSLNPNSNNTIEVIKEFLKSRYQAETKLLNLSLVKQDPSLASRGFFGSISTTSKFFPALMKVAKELKINVLSIDLSGNELNDLTTISSLAHTFPLLENLSLLNNNFTRIKVFDVWKHKLNYLRELILIGNPLLNQQNEILNIKTELMRVFPRLIVFNGELLRNEEVLKSNLSFPFEFPQSMFFQDEEIQNISTNFITNFYNLWDSNRQDLLILYQNESQFSMLVDSAHPYLLDNNTNHYSGGTDFGNYLSQSRNLSKVSAAKSRLSRVAVGQEQIFKLFSSLPKTRHDLLTKPHLFSMESFRFPQLNGIMLTLHGSFEETDQPATLPEPPHNGLKNRYNNQKHKKVALSTKSFDRTFIIIPGPNGSMIVASDLLSVRPYAGAKAWNEVHPVNEPPHIPANIPPVQPVSHPGTPTPSDLPPEVKANLNPMQQEILVKILLETKLNLQYSVMLCEQSNWDYQLSINNFKSSVASIPREAYLP